MKINFLLFLLMVIQSSLSAQDKSGNSSAADEIKNFKNGAAVVRLYMNKPKVDLLKKSIEGTEDVKEKTALEKMLATHLNERQAYKNRLIKAFTENYDFSSLYFLHDYDILRLKNGEKKGIFLNPAGEVDPNIVMKETHYLIFARGQNDDNIELVAPDNRHLPSDFPTKYNRGIGRLFTMLFQPKDKLSESVDKLNMALRKYYQKRIF